MDQYRWINTSLNNHVTSTNKVTSSLMHTLTFIWKSKKSHENFYEFKCNITKKFVQISENKKEKQGNLIIVIRW